MHLSHCTLCGRRELRGARSLHAIATPRGDVLGSTCRGCGAELAASDNRVLQRPAADIVA
jgi:hypothetical protein